MGRKRKGVLPDRQTALLSSEGNKKERFNAEPKANVGGDRPLIMRISRCGYRPPYQFPTTLDYDWTL